MKKRKSDEGKKRLEKKKTDRKKRKRRGRADDATESECKTVKTRKDENEIKI